MIDPTALQLVIGVPPVVAISTGGTVFFGHFALRGGFGSRTLLFRVLGRCVIGRGRVWQQSTELLYLIRAQWGRVCHLALYPRS